MKNIPIFQIINNIFDEFINKPILNSEYLNSLKNNKQIVSIFNTKQFTTITLHKTLYKQFFSTIITIDLHDINIDNIDISILNLVLKYGNVSSIILRNITFSTVGIENNFLNYLEKNTQIEILILRNIGITYIGGIDNIGKLLHIIGMLNNITFLEFSGFKFAKIQNLYIDFLHNYTDTLNRLFYETLIKLEKLEFLIFNDNLISHRLYYNIFNTIYEKPITIISNKLTIKNGVMNITDLNDRNKRTLYYYTNENYTFSFIDEQRRALANFGINKEINTEMEKIQTKLNIDNLYLQIIDINEPFINIDNTNLNHGGRSSNRNRR